MSDLYNVGQGVSKGFWAGGLGAPVDLITTLTNLAIAATGSAGRATGMLKPEQMPSLIEKPVGGSEWIADKMRGAGLLKDAIGTKADTYGQVAGGLLGPAVGYAGPKIAAGVNQMAANASAPRTLNPQTGAVVWHGTPHKFDKFDSSKIGTGEGAQAYGHGLYLAESPAVAKEYATNLSSAGLAKNTLAQNGGDIDGAIAAAQQSVSNYKSLIANGGGGDPRRAQGMLTLAEKKLSDLRSMKSGTLDESGNLYKVDLPDEHIAKMLDWDKPLSQQPAVIEAMKGTSLESFIPYADQMTGGQMISQLGNNSAASSQLKARGIPGIRYLDGGSRDSGNGTSNFVVFPGNESLLQILERNGAPIK